MFLRRIHIMQEYDGSDLFEDDEIPQFNKKALIFSVIMILLIVLVICFLFIMNNIDGWVKLNQFVWSLRPK
jgi:uncharacterized integral membrane protein